MKLYLMATQMVYYLALLPWAYFWGRVLLIIMHDPSSQSTFLFMLASLYPVAVIVCTIFAWLFHVNKKSLSIAINLVPAIWIIVYFIY